MDKFLADVFTVYFWVGVVLVGIFINILTSFLTKFSLRILATFSSHYHNISEKKAKGYKADLLRLCTDFPYRDFTYHREIRYRFKALQNLLYSAIFAVSGISIISYFPYKVARELIMGYPILSSIIILIPLIASAISAIESFIYITIASSIAKKLDKSILIS